MGADAEADVVRLVEHQLKGTPGGVEFLAGSGDGNGGVVAALFDAEAGGAGDVGL